MSLGKPRRIFVDDTEDTMIGAIVDTDPRSDHSSQMRKKKKKPKGRLADASKVVI